MTTSNTQRDYEVLLIESDEEIVEDIIDAFCTADISAAIAESKSLSRAQSLVTSENINLIIFGPSLSHNGILEFFSSQSIKDKFPSLYLFWDKNEKLEKEVLDAGLTSSLKFPFESSSLKKSINDSKNIFLEKLTSSHKSESLSNLKLSQVEQLAIILDRLAKRLTKVSSKLKSLPLNSELSEPSIPHAVNRVILEATQFRKDKEAEDLSNLIKNIIK